MPGVLVSMDSTLTAQAAQVISNTGKVCFLSVPMSRWFTEDRFVGGVCVSIIELSNSNAKVGNLPASGII